MYARLTVFLFACLLFLPSCQHNPGDTFASKADAPVDLHYEPGSVDLHTAVNVTVSMNGMAAHEVPMISFDGHYNVKRTGSRLAWSVVLDNQVPMGSPLAPEPFYSMTFTTDAKGRNKAAKVIHEVPGKDEMHLGETLLSEIELPVEKVSVGDPSIELSVKALQSADMQIVLPEPSPAYTYDGVKEIDGRECYTFSYESQLTVRQNGEEYPGVMRISTACGKDMLPVSERCELTMNGPVENMVTKLVATTREIPARDTAISAEEAAEKAMGELRLALRNAPLQKVTEPMTFRYVPASIRLKTFATLTPGVKGNPPAKLPFIEYIMKIDTSAESRRLAWNVAISDLKVLGQPLELPPSFGITFTTDEQGRNIQDFQDNTGAKLLTPADIQSDFIIPEGTFKSGDVCMPVKMRDKAAHLQYEFPDGEGFVFQGVKQVDSMRVALFSADIDHFTAKSGGKEIAQQGHLTLVRYYDLATMMPLWYDGIVVMDMEKGSVTTTGGMTRIMD